MVTKRPHRHDVLTKALTSAKTKAKPGSFVYLVRLAYSLAFNNFNPPVVLVVPYISSSNNEDADALAAALIDPQGIWCWNDLEAVNYEFDAVETQDLIREVSGAAKQGTVAFCGYKPAN